MVQFGNINIVVKKGDITLEYVDVIVNAANSGLLGGGGVDGAIHRAGGPSIMEECMQIRKRMGTCPTGEAVMTNAGDLKARKVVHAVGPVWEGGNKGESVLLRHAYMNSLSLAEKVKARSIAFPAISTGIYGFPIEQAVLIVLQTVWDFSQEDPGLSEIRFVLFSERDLAVYEEALIQFVPNTRSLA